MSPVLPAPYHTEVPSDFSLGCSVFCYQSSLKADVEIVFLTGGNCSLRSEKVTTMIFLMVWRKQFKKWRNRRSLYSISNPSTLFLIFWQLKELARMKCFIIILFSFFQCCSKNFYQPQKLDVWSKDPFASCLWGSSVPKQIYPTLSSVDLGEYMLKKILLFSLT